MYRDVLTFWFDELAPPQWWKADPALDRTIFERFSDLHDRAARCELFEWRREPRGRLAEIVILDQFSRNLFRGSARAFAQDALALALAQEAISAGAEDALTPIERSFLYMPFMHSESLKIHEVALALFRKNGLQSNLDYEVRHKAILERFGRYPHRNGALGRQSTAAELRFLNEPGSTF